ncbi:equilibrative nucleoside transporter 3 isoform X2 [Cherax quadricarinatus]|nr:equilibrative nucleoside transporter 3-like isoform X2 [Cherax quadricarinatus]
MLPWNFFITADMYWQYKLRNVSLGEEWDASDASLTPLQKSFMPTLVIVSNVFSVVFFIINSAVVKKVREGVRILGSLSLLMLAMILITIFTSVTTDSWQTTFFVITMIIVALLNMCTAVLQGSLYGLAGLFPSSCVSSVISGQAIAGVFSSLARIISLLVGEEPVTSALIFFTIADVFLVFTIVGYIFLTKGMYYMKVKKEVEKKLLESPQEARSDYATYVAVLKKVWPMGTTLGGSLIVTLMIYPSVLVYITSTSPESRWTQIFFQPTITFLLFNLSDWCGRETPRWLKWPSERGWQLHVAALCRIIFLPLLMLCHGTNKTFPTIFANDAYYIPLLILFAFTGGHFGTLTLIYYPSRLESEEMDVGGAIMGALMGVGMVTGSLLSPAMVALWGPQ